MFSYQFRLKFVSLSIRNLLIITRTDGKLKEETSLTLIKLLNENELIICAFAVVPCYFKRKDEVELTVEPG